MHVHIYAVDNINRFRTYCNLKDFGKDFSKTLRIAKEHDNNANPIGNFYVFQAPRRPNQTTHLQRSGSLRP